MMDMLDVVKILIEKLPQNLKKECLNSKEVNPRMPGSCFEYEWRDLPHTLNFLMTVCGNSTSRQLEFDSFNWNGPFCQIRSELIAHNKRFQVKIENIGRSSNHYDEVRFTFMPLDSDKAFLSIDGSLLWKIAKTSAAEDVRDLLEEALDTHSNMGSYEIMRKDYDYEYLRRKR